MHKFILFIVSCLLFSSCAIMLNRDETLVYLYTADKAKVVYKSDTLITEANDGYNAVAIEAKRSKYPLSFKIITDSVPKGKKINIEPQISSTVYLNLLTMPTIVYGLFDFTSSRRFTYKSPILLNSNLYQDENIPLGLKQDLRKRKNKYLTTKPSIGRNKGDFFLNFSFPLFYPGTYTFKPENQSRKSGGHFFGLSAGFDYYYKKNRFINLHSSLVFAGDISFEDDTPYSYNHYSSYDYIKNRINPEYSDERIGSLTFSISDNRIINRISYGYGLTYAYNTSREKSYLNYRPGLIPSIQEKTWDYSTIGLIFSGHYYFTSYFSGGIIYKPTFVQLKTKSAGAFCYEHQISLDFSFRIKLFRGK